MKTVVIWDSMGQDNVKFFIVEGDYSHLNNVYINSGETEKEDELEALMSYDNEGKTKHEMLSEFPLN
jgi:hypothetical protein